MQFAVSFRITGILLSIFSLTLLLPVVVATIYGENTSREFIISFLVTAAVGLLLVLTIRSRRELRSGDGFFVTVLFYVALGLFGSLPFVLDGRAHTGFTDAVFESLSGLTTTGATVFTGLDELPRSLLFYRQLLQWFGGMGIIVLAVAILPMLGIGGMQLYRAESPGPVKDSKLTPRIAQTAKALWVIYVTLTAVCALAYRLCGMDTFDAICHAFSTVAIGGFSTHDLSIGYFDSRAIESVAVVFMILSACNFGLHFSVARNRSLLLYWRDPEARTMLLLLLAGCAVVIPLLHLDPALSDSPIMDGLFQVVSMMTTTGFTTADYTSWPPAIPIMLILASFAGGCAGSTAGGMKIVRVMLIYLQGIREVRTLIHPNGIFPIKLGGSPVPQRVVEAVWSFCAVYALSFLGLLAAVSLVSGLDFESAFSAVAACLNNLGPGLGEVAANVQNINAPTKWILIVAMLLGRLEIFTLLVLLTPAFWRR